MTTSGEGYTLEQAVANLVERFAPSRTSVQLRRLWILNGECMAAAFNENPEDVEQEILSHLFQDPNQGVLL